MPEDAESALITGGDWLSPTASNTASATVAPSQSAAASAEPE